MSLANNNGTGYVPYVDYNTEYLPPPPAGSQHQQPQYLQQQLMDQQQPASPQHASLFLTTDRDPYGELYAGTGLVDSRGFARPYLASPAYLRSPGAYASNISPTTNAGLGSVSSGSQSPSLAHYNHLQPLAQQSPLSLAFSPSSNQMYITTTASSQPVKHATLATHV